MRIKSPGSLVALSLLVAGLWFACGRGARGAAEDRTAVVTHAQGIDLAPGARCTVRVRDESRGGFECRVEIVCGEIPLFGGRIAGGFARCSARDGRWTHAVDRELASRDGDPAMALDLQRGLVHVDTGRAQVFARLDPVRSAR